MSKEEVFPNAPPNHLPKWLKRDFGQFIDVDFSTENFNLSDIPSKIQKKDFF